MLIAGGTGQLGRELSQTVPNGWTVSAPDPRTLDITEAARVAAVVGSERPELIVNAAAYAAVDRAEVEPDLAARVNSLGAGNLARAATAVGARLIHVSTDFVFDGASHQPYRPDDPAAPLGVYGKTKLQGEQAVREAGGDALILRTAWLYGAHGSNFVLTMLRLMRERDSVGVVMDQVGAPTWVRSLAGAIWAAASRPAVAGVHHWTDAGVASRYDFALAIQAEALGLGLLCKPAAVRPIRTADCPTPARRPAYSVLDTSQTREALGTVPAHWRANLRLMLVELAHA